MKPSLVLTGLSVAEPEELVDAVSQRVTQALGSNIEMVRAALRDALRAGGWSLGSGIGVPHAELPGLGETVICLVVTARPVELPSIDRRSPDVFFLILAPPEQREQHLLLLAHLARLAQSRTLIEGLRKSRSPQEAVALVRAAELRHFPAVAEGQISDHVVILIAIAGEHAVDALLVELFDRGFGEATLIEAQSVREATTREVPLFVGFDDIFGDPGGRRLILLDARASDADEIVSTVQRVAGEQRAREVRISVVPLQTHWQQLPHSEEPGEGGGRE